MSIKETERIAVIDNLAEIFTIQSERIVSKDLIVQYKNTKYQLMPDNGYRYTLRKAAIRISEHKDGTITFNYKKIRSYRSFPPRTFLFWKKSDISNWG